MREINFEEITLRCEINSRGGGEYVLRCQQSGISNVEGIKYLTYHGKPTLYINDMVVKAEDIINRLRYQIKKHIIQTY